MYEYALYALMTLLFLSFDLFPSLIVRIKKLKPLRLSRNRCNDYTIVVTIYRKPVYLKNLPKLKKYGRKVLILTTNRETEAFNKKLAYYCDKYNYVKAVVALNDSEPYPVSSMPIFIRGVANVKSKYMIRMDADSIPQKNLDFLFGTVNEHNLDLASVKVLPLKSQMKGNILERIQWNQYEKAMKSRVMYPYHTSGAAIVAKTSLLHEITKHHSGYDNGEDIELGKLAKKLNARIDYIDFTVFTEVPTTFKRWFFQREYWGEGEFRHAVINVWTNTPWQIFYYTFVFFGLLPLRIWFTIQYWYLVPLIRVYYMFYQLIIDWKTYDVSFLFHPIYSFIETVVLPIFAIKKYLVTVLKNKKLGIIKFRTKVEWNPNT